MSFTPARREEVRIRRLAIYAACTYIEHELGELCKSLEKLNDEDASLWQEQMDNLGAGEL